MSEAEVKEAEEHALQTPEASILDSIFDTHRILNFAIAASSIGIIILLSLSYLLR